MSKIVALPKQLRQLVSKCVAILGEVIKEQVDDQFFLLVESLRKQMLTYKRLTALNQQQLLAKTLTQLNAIPKERKRLLAHSFTLMIQLINACETAYRTFRLRKKRHTLPSTNTNNIIVFVITAHPTEARSPANIHLFQQIRNSCLHMLQTSNRDDELIVLKHLLKLAWLTPVAKHKSPTVLDEAESIYSILLRDDIVDELLLLNQIGIDVRLRTWVGGDKDGHPGVDEKIMLTVLAHARKRLVSLVLKKLEKVENELCTLNISHHRFSKLHKEATSQLKKLNSLTLKDGERLSDLKQIIKTINKDYEKEIGLLHPELMKVTTLLQAFPALVLPIELREDAKEVHQALKATKPPAITRMLEKVALISKHSKAEYYVKGLILSMTQSVQDIHAGLELTNRVLGHRRMRIVPLFETEKALLEANNIINNLFQEQAILGQIKVHWDNKFEIMLGYSDSSKGMGVLASRLNIAKTMRQLDTLCNQFQITPIFFHGSGGSVDRGGGSIKDQTAWWPQSSFNIYKTTLQGEMVERSFANRYIMRSMVNKLQTESQKPHFSDLPKQSTVSSFAHSVSKIYQQQIQEPEFLDVVEHATSYKLLDKLKFGSRPVKRKGKLSVDSLRAIPWVLCWTQTRVLFPTWWGIGSSWKRLSTKAKEELKIAYTTNSLFRTYIHSLGFTLTKVELPVWKQYLLNSNLRYKRACTISTMFETEYDLTCQAISDLTQQPQLLWFRPWLKESIELRTPIVNLLNLLQICAMKDNDVYLIRETTTGIAAGMLTTG